ncbi:hypothetical protein EZS27_002770 [termite gut metagenome]|uniref:DUF4943 domain-containing protein n=1 Tax=termite gut metagenome TaxID=433724 RepID=A0A5J4SUV5_9ZZZZ
MKRALFGLLFMLIIIIVGSCNEERLDYYNPDVKLFVKQLKAGTYHTKNPLDVVEVPLFNEEDILELLQYSDDLTKIHSFPLPSASCCEGEACLGECMLWIVETIRIGRVASLGYRLVHADADNYKRIYFLSDEEVLEASTFYRKWWEDVKNISPYPSVYSYNIDPLRGSKYRWW